MEIIRANVLVFVYKHALWKLRGEGGGQGGGEEEGGQCVEGDGG